MKGAFLAFIIIPVILSGIHTRTSQASETKQVGENEDSLIWHKANEFTYLFNKSDTEAMNLLLTDDFMLQWLHENFLGKKSLLEMMVDSAVHSTFRHVLNKDVQTLIRYSDDRNVACVNATVEFLDPTLSQSIKKENGYGLCIMYFQKIHGNWILKTVHLDLHCSVCTVGP